ncbi:hypothetical protein [Clavibacter zhangzhiyongii]|uniref:hypothetical protein n=1 Tax=Clavibacter zhangzhiyongii TaxID=2768071 RepID=UPI0039E10EBB
MSADWGVEWVVATLAPWTISPHPNFKEESLSGAAALALVTEMRDRGDGGPTTDWPGQGVEWGTSLVSNARASLRSHTQIEAAAALINTARSPHLPPGARAAAALYGSVALCELERHDEAIVALIDLAEELTSEDKGVENFTASQRLIIASVYMQAGARLTESCSFSEAQRRVDLVLKWLPALKASGFQKFPVSTGISWSSATVQRDITRSLINHALSLRSYLEQMGGQTWERVVRGRSSWVDMRMHYRSADRDEIVLRDAFERRIEADSNTQHFGRSAADGAGYKSLTLAELSGHLGYVRGEREKLGKVLILERGDDAERVREALRLLRQGRATKALQSVITWIRAQGPTKALLQDALIVTARVNSAHWCTEQDLLVLEGASEFLSPDQKDRAIAAALVFRTTPQLQSHMSWTSWERLWKTITRLIPESSRQEEIAGLAFAYVNNQRTLSQTLANTLARLVSALEWDKVSQKAIANWVAWAEASERNFDTSILFDAVDYNIRGIARSLPVEVGLEKAAYVADGEFPISDTSKVLRELSDYIVKVLREEAEQASNGMMSMKDYQAANVAVAFVLRFPDEALWAEVLKHLLNPAVDAGLKDLALQRLAENLDKVPADVANELRAGSELLLGSARRDTFFAQASSSVFGEAIRLSAALHAIPVADLLKTVLRLSSSDVKDRVQAARTIPFCITDAEVIWGHVLLLQLSHDVDPSVRSAAGQALVRSLSVSSELNEMIYARITELLRSDGIRVPLAILHGIQRDADSASAAIMPLLPEIRQMATAGGNYITRGAAGVCVELLAPKGTGAVGS